MRIALALAGTLLALAQCGSALAAPQLPGAPNTPSVLAPGGGGSWPSGCRDIDVSTNQTSFLFGTQIYRFHALEHWCWSGGGIYDERHGWSFDGSSTACLGTVYPANSWSYVYWNGIATSGHYTEERAHVTNCVFHVGDWKEFYPDVKIWAHADGTYSTATGN